MILYTITILDDRGAPVDEFGFGNGELLIGRTENNDVVLPSNSVSRRHARLFMEEGRCLIEDLGSANGVLLDGRRIDRPMALSGEANIIIGDYTLRLVRRSGTAATPHAPSAPAVVVHDASRTGIAHLVRIDPEHSGAILTMRGPRATLGRADRSDVHLPEKGISRHHGTFELRGHQWVYVDAGSANGTWVNDVPVTQPVVLREGDEIRAGSALLVFTYDPSKVDPAAPDRFEATRTRMVATQARATGSAQQWTPWIIVGVLAVVVLSLVTGMLFQSRRSASSGPVGEASATTASQANRGQEATLFQALEEAEGAMEDERWTDAIRTLESAEALHGESDALRRLRSQATAGRDASRRFEECISRVEAAEGLELANQPLAAAETFEDARTCLREIPSASPYHERAQERLQQRVLPSLITLHRYLSSLAIQSNEFEGAVQSLQRALTLHEERPEDAREGTDAIRRQLRSARIQAGDHAWERRAWQRAVDHYEAAHAIEDLDAGRQSRVERRGR